MTYSGSQGAHLGVWRSVQGIVFATWALLALMTGVAEAAESGRDRHSDRTSVAIVASDAHQRREVMELKIEKGDTLFDLLGVRGLRVANRQAALHALSDVYDPRQLRPGDVVRLVLDKQGGDTFVRSLHLETARLEDLTVDIVGGATPSEGEHSRDAKLSVQTVSGVVGSSFRGSLQRLKVPKKLVGEVLIAFENDPDIPASLPKTSRFSIVYETVFDSHRVLGPKLKYVELNDGHKTHRVYKYHTDSGRPALVHENGRGVALIDLARPIDVELVTSPYGWRIHPILGDRRFHKGVDFGAPSGTPVMAAADGIVADAGWRGNYGRYIGLDHGTGVVTAYAHLSRFARGVAPGRSVHRGQVIGYVGESGLATGPHLYYEVMLNGKHVDPLNVPDVVPVRLTGDTLVAFRQYSRTLYTSVDP